MRRGSRALARLVSYLMGEFQWDWDERRWVVMMQRILGISKAAAYNVKKRLRRAIDRAVQAVEEGGGDGQEA